VRYAARTQPLDWLSDRRDQMSTVPVHTDLSPTPQAPWATRRVLHSVLEVCGWGSATAHRDATLPANDVITSAVEHAAAENALVLELVRPQGRFRLLVADGSAVCRIVGDRDDRCSRRSRHVPRRGPGRPLGLGTMTTAAQGSPDRVSTAAPAGRRLVCGRVHRVTAADISTRRSSTTPTRSSSVTNALIHGRSPVRSRLWTAPDRIVATVTDLGDGPTDPFAGLLPVSNTSLGGLGLWLTHQLCSHVTLDTTDDWFTICLVVATPQPGRSGHAPDNA
jgi:hypothetical protein